MSLSTHGSSDKKVNEVENCSTALNHLVQGEADILNITQECIPSSINQLSDFSENLVVYSFKHKKKFIN